MRYLEVRRHTMRVQPGQHLSQAGVDLARLVGTSIGPFARVVTSTLPRAFETAIAMGFAVDEQIDALSLMPQEVGDEVDWQAGFGAFGRALRRDGPAARFCRQQADAWRRIVSAVPDGARVLAITHAGIIEAGAVGALPDADHASWGQPCSFCEGVRLAFDGQRCLGLEVLRV